MLIFESNPQADTMDVFKALDCEKAIWTGDYPPLGFIYNLFMANTERFFLRVDDDCQFVCDPTEQIQDAMSLLDDQPLNGRAISNVPLEMNPRMAYDVATGACPEGANSVPRFIGYVNSPKRGPLGLVGHPGSLPVVDKRFVFPWNETCHWRQTELYHILLGERAGYLSAYMLRWWGCMGHFSPEGVDGVSRQRNLNAYRLYQDKGYWGRRPESTWGTAYLGLDLPAQETR
jgi:hypothetical protein